MKNVVSYSLWGNHPMYWKGALKNIELVNKFYAGFTCRFYIDRNCDKALIDSINGSNVEVILVDSHAPFHGMFWRFWASQDPEVDIFLSRDCDSRICEREVEAVEEWLKSDKDFHIMRDHPYHDVPILGGMWGCRNGILRNINLSGLIENFGNFEGRGCDQDFLAQMIYPYIKPNAMEHSEFGLWFSGDVKPFPTPRKNFEFVGDVFDENNIRHPDFWRMIQQREQVNLREGKIKRILRKLGLK